MRVGLPAEPGHFGRVALDLLVSKPADKRARQAAGREQQNVVGVRRDGRGAIGSGCRVAERAFDELKITSVGLRAGPRSYRHGDPCQILPQLPGNAPHLAQHFNGGLTLRERAGEYGKKRSDRAHDHQGDAARDEQFRQAEATGGRP